MNHESWIVLVCDEASGNWSVAVNKKVGDAVDGHEKAATAAHEFFNEMRGSGDTSPAIVLFTGDFVQV